MMVWHVTCAPWLHASLAHLDLWPAHEPSIVSVAHDDLLAVWTAGICLPMGMTKSKEELNMASDVVRVAELLKDKTSRSRIVTLHLHPSNSCCCDGGRRYLN